ncbi:MAG: hypothetical protein V1784_06090, partial [bacterium]
MARHSLRVVAVCLSIFFPLSAITLGQITITSEDIPSEIGCRHALRASSGYVPVSPGSAGESQTWDLTDIPVTGNIEVEIVSRDDTP